MAQVGEPISPSQVDDDDKSCPFEHDLEDPPSVKNDLKGVGTTLGKRMKATKGTHLYSAIMGDYKPTAVILNPKDDSSHVLYKKAEVVKIDAVVASDDNPNKKQKVIYSYPVTCAAHHCIPAQESLKDHPLLAFMCKKDTSEAKNHSYADGQVWSNVGYDVNGSQNGVYIPGSYAVGGGRGGMGVWTEDTPDKESEDVGEPAAENSNLLTGQLNEISGENRKWLYVKQAMKFAKGQFHDRHVDYSTKFVKGVLTKIHLDYVKRYKGSFMGNDCGKCKDRKKKADKLGIPTPYGLVARLNKVSDKCKAYLSSNQWPLNVYTSNWGRAYMEAKLAGNKDAD